MSWLLIIMLSLLVFLNRYIFLDPNLRLRLPNFIQGMLHYSAPCLLTAICIPVIFFNQQDQFRPWLDNHYVWAGLATAVSYLISKRILISSIIGFGSFYIFYTYF